MTSRCPNCQAELPEKASVCPQCGTAIINDDVTITSEEFPTLKADTLIDDNDDVTVKSDITLDNEDKTVMSPDTDTQIAPGKTPESAKVTRVATTAEDQTIDVGQTAAMPDSDDGGTQAMPSDDDGGTRAMPDPLEAEGQTAAMPDPRIAARAEEAARDVTAMSDLKTGRVLQERYRLDKILGKGGFGAAFLAEDIKLKRVCVVKQMLTPEDVSAKDLELHRANFEREASLLVQLNHPGHPNIPEIYDYFFDAGGNYLVMKYIEGQSLKGVLDKGERKIPWREAVRYTIDVCSALHYMHTQGDEPVMHRDIKPANILLGDDGRVWLVDFGLAKAKPVESTGDLMATQAAGSLGYTPLEQWLGEATPASDIYAVGATLHHLVSGLHPMKAFGSEFNVQKLKEMHGQFTPVRKTDKSLPKQLDQIITRATDPDPEKRLTAQQLQQQLDALISGAQAAALYTFKNGESANTVQDLVIMCEKNRQEAQQYLYQGDFERWFLLINRNDLAEAAVKAVKQGKNQKDGLEKFIKLIMPNIFFNRLRRAAGRLSRTTIWIIVLLLIFVVLLVIGGSYGAGWFIRQSINSSEWSFDHLNLDEDNVYTEAEINKGAQDLTSAYFDEFNIDMQPPDQVNLHAGWGNIDFTLLVLVRLESGKPHFYLDNINDIPLILIGDNISQGINNGIDDVFAKAPVDIAHMDVTEEKVAFSVKPSGRVPMPTPTPTITPTPTRTPTPVPTATRAGVTLVAVFNELDKDIILELEDESWDIPAGGSVVFEKKPGSYDFVVLYKESGKVAAEGSKSWNEATYKWRITNK